MGYTTEFKGMFNLDKVLLPEHKNYLTLFNETRRMKRDNLLVTLLNDPARQAVGLPVGFEGAYFTGGTGEFGQGHDDSILDYNTPPGKKSYSEFNGNWDAYKEQDMSSAQPGLWCQWRPTDDGMGIEWDEGEKFYEYVAWIEYLIEHFLEPWGYNVNGEIQWRGEEWDDSGTIHIENNVVTLK